MELKTYNYELELTANDLVLLYRICSFVERHKDIEDMKELIKAAERLRKEIDRSQDFIKE